MDDLPNLQELKTEESIFDNLQKNALETIRELSGQLWTDHAPHDPGITTLDILNYALSELDYQMSFPLEQYLTCLLYTSPSPRDRSVSRMPSSA